MKLLASALLASALVLTACGGGGSSEPETPSTTPSASPTAPAPSVGVRFKWDRLSNNQWRCRDSDNGQFSASSNCAGQPYVDNWS